MSGDEALRAGLGKVRSKDDIVRFMNQNGCYTTKEKLEAFFNPRAVGADGALDDESLNKVVGGASPFSDSECGYGYCPVCGTKQVFIWNGMTFCSVGTCNSLVFTVEGTITYAISLNDGAGGYVTPEPGRETLDKA